MSQTLKTIESFTPEAKEKFKKSSDYILEIWDVMNGAEVPATVERDLRISLPQMVEALTGMADAMALIAVKLAADGEK